MELNARPMLSDLEDIKPAAPEKRADRAVRPGLTSMILEEDRARLEPREMRSQTFEDRPLMALDVDLDQIHPAEFQLREQPLHRPYWDAHAFSVVRQVSM